MWGAAMAFAPSPTASCYLKAFLTYGVYYRVRSTYHRKVWRPSLCAGNAHDFACCDAVQVDSAAPSQTTYFTGPAIAARERWRKKRGKKGPRKKAISGALGGDPLPTRQRKLVPIIFDLCPLPLTITIVSLRQVLNADNHQNYCRW